MAEALVAFMAGRNGWADMVAALGEATMGLESRQMMRGAVAELAWALGGVAGSMGSSVDRRWWCICGRVGRREATLGHAWLSYLRAGIDVHGDSGMRERRLYERAVREEWVVVEVLSVGRVV
jgi:hypothetical protein